MKQKFNIINSTCVPLPLENVDTDQIIPARFLKATTKEGFGENPYLVGSFTKSFITGLQSESVAATAKHFAGYGADNEDVVTFFE